MATHAPTHEDARRAQVAEMKRGLSVIAFFGKDEESRKIAQDALEKSRRAYRDGVLKAVD